MAAAGGCAPSQSDSVGSKIQYGLDTASGFDGSPESIQSFESRSLLRLWLRDLSQGILKEIVDQFGNGVLPFPGQASHRFVLIVVEE
jgi:hypothetical protein